jgi:adenine deaminase
MKISGQLVNIHEREIYPAELTISGGIIESIEGRTDAPGVFILPGLIDAHIHIESSMITPGAFGFEVVKHGTVGTVSDPHEIANVLGVRGVDFMISDARKSPVKFWFGAPSCVPATVFETNGASLNSADVDKMLQRSDIKYLSEVMNFPGVIHEDEEVMKKINAARREGKPVDGHAPGLAGEDLRKYIGSGISTDHECSSPEEAREKIKLGMKVLIREGSAARNLDSLKELYDQYPEMIMLCSDDLHPEMLAEGHINVLIAKLINEGYNLFDVIRSATLNPVMHYNLEAGLLRKGDSADFIVVGDLGKMEVLETWIEGRKVYQNGTRSFEYKPGKPLNNFRCSTIKTEDITLRRSPGKVRVIEAFDGKLYTGEIQTDMAGDYLVSSSTGRDILKIVVKDRYNDSPPAVGFIKGFGIKEGAFAGSIAHDSHNIVCIGTNDNDIVAAINEIVRLKGGLTVSAGGTIHSLQLDIAGIMTTGSCTGVAAKYGHLNEMVRSLGCRMKSPFMTLSFMSLLVIPNLKIGDRGLFDVNRFSPVPLFIDSDSQNNRFM